MTYFVGPTVDDILCTFVLGMTLNCIRQSYICCHQFFFLFTYIYFLQLMYIAIQSNVRLYSLKQSSVKEQFSTIDVLVAMLMTRSEFRIVPCLAGGNASATCLKKLVMRFVDVQ